MATQTEYVVAVAAEIMAVTPGTSRQWMTPGMVYLNEGTAGGGAAATVRPAIVYFL